MKTARQDESGVKWVVVQRLMWAERKAGWTVVQCVVGPTRRIQQMGAGLCWTGGLGVGEVSSSGALGAVVTGSGDVDTVEWW